MYEAQIHGALDADDLNSAWLWLVKRTAWMQHTTFEAQDVAQIWQETQALEGKLQARMDELKQRMHDTLQHRLAVSAYSQWGE